MTGDTGIAGLGAAAVVLCVVAAVLVVALAFIAEWFRGGPDDN